MPYDLSDLSGGLRECPRCRRTMTWLRDFQSVRRNEGYLLDYGTDNYAVTWAFWGEVGAALHWFYRNTFQPVMSLTIGAWNQARRDRILRSWPRSLICPGCSYVLRRR